MTTPTPTPTDAIEPAKLLRVKLPLPTGGRKWIALGAACVGLGGAVGCGRPDPAPSVPTSVAKPAPPKAAPPRREGRQTFTLRGVVQAVDAQAGEVTIAHEAMPGFMDAMTMPFTIREKKALDDVQPGDVVQGPIEVDFRNDSIKNYQLTDLTVTGSVPLKRVESSPPADLRPAVLAVGDLVPDFLMTTQTGASLRLSDLRGKVVALTFIYTRCPLPDFCPAVDAKFAEVARRVTTVAARADQVALLSVSFDSEHDTPPVLAKHAHLRGAKPPWVFAVASPAELGRVGPPLGLDYYPDRDQFGHNLTAAVIGPDGRLVRLELGRKWTPADLAKVIIDHIPRPARP